MSSGVWARRALYISGGLVVGWFVLLLVLDAVLAGRTKRSTEARVAESLQAQVSIARTEVALVRGSLELGGLEARRDDTAGHLVLDVDEVDCDLAPLGLALLDRQCQALAIRGLRLEVSTAALLKVKHRKQQPIEVGSITIDDAKLAFSPSALVPDLGQIEITIEHAESGRTVLFTPISWLLTATDLRARIALPAGISLQLVFANGQLTASGSLFGSTPVTIPVELPVRELPTDAASELHQLVSLGTQIAERLVAKRASDWLQRKLKL